MDIPVALPQDGQMTLIADKPDLSDMSGNVDSGDQIRFMVPTLVSTSILKSSYMLRTLLFLSVFQVAEV